MGLPGGGVDPGETQPEALQRELREELGLVLDASDIGEPIWFKEHKFAMADWDGQADTYYRVEVDAFEPAPHFTAADLRAEHVDSMRWWTWAELAEAQRRQDTRNAVGSNRDGNHESGDQRDADLVTLSPRPLFHLLEDLMTHGRPRGLLRLDPL